MQYSTYNTCCQRHALRHHSCFSDITFTSALVQEKLSKSGKKKSEFFLLLLQSFFKTNSFSSRSLWKPHSNWYNISLSIICKQTSVQIQYYTKKTNKQKTHMIVNSCFQPWSYRNRGAWPAKTQKDGSRQQMTSLLVCTAVAEGENSKFNEPVSPLNVRLHRLVLYKIMSTTLTE